MPVRMLVIDDEEIVLDACRKLFESEGYEVVFTTSPEEGVKLARDSHHDVILIDWQMPGKDGFDVVEEIDHASPDSAVIMISGYPSHGRATEAMKRGAMDYVAKPFTPAEILDAVKRAVQRKLSVDRKTARHIEKAVKLLEFPRPDMDDKAPRTIAETVAATIGVSKATSPWLSVTVLGILAGAYIGFGGLLSTSVTFDLSAKVGLGLTKFLSGATFSLGLMLVVIAGAELFTGNNLMLSSVLSRHISAGTMVGRWAVVFLANFVGALLLAALFYWSGLWKVGEGALGKAAVGIAYTKANIPFVEALVRGIGCNWLVCLAVWMALASRQVIGKIFAIFFPIMGFVAIGFEHCIANMYFIPVGLALHAWQGIPGPDRFPPESLDLASFLVGSLVPVSIGNVVGGALCVGMSYGGAYLSQVKK